MKKSIGFLYLAAVLSMAGCKTENKKDTIVTEAIDKSERAIAPKEMNKADTLIAETIKAHGGELYENASYGFTFRGKYYTFENSNRSYTYTMSRTENGDELKYMLKNGKFMHTKNGAETELSTKDIAKYTEDVNSVVYFATLPNKLNDKAVNKTYEHSTAIKGQNYDVIAVAFDKEGGGIDYNDKFMYWINSDSKTIDYLAYSYETNVGGVRFRTAYNPRTIDGVRFQDYINYKVPKGTPLKDIPALYEKDELKELSRIEMEDVLNMRK